MRSRWRPPWLPPRVPCTPDQLWSGSAGSRAAGAARARARAALLHPSAASFFASLLHPWGLNPHVFFCGWGTCEGLGGWFRVAGVSGGCGVCVGTAGFGHAGHNDHLPGKEPSTISCFLAYSTDIGLGRAETFAQSVHVILRYM